MRVSLRCFVLLGAIGISCAGADPPTPQDPPEQFLRLPPLMQALTTREQVLAPSHAIAATPANNPALVENQQRYLDGGFGALAMLPGEPYVARTLDGSAPPAPGPNARRLVRFVHLADVHVVDDESPLRFGSFDLPQPTTAALRPQDPDSCRMVHAAVRTVNALHRQDPLAFTLLGGDSIDNMQGNELDWFLAVMDGGIVKCDSGNSDDPVAGGGNDGKDSFFSEGLAMPWRWVTGNHDVLVQGFMTLTPELQAQAIGSEAPGGTRNYARGGALQDGDFVVADARRALIERTALLRKVNASGDGHGIAEAQLASGKAFYSFDVPDTSLRFVILDTGSESGGDGGMLHRADVQAHVTPILDAAKSAGKFVVLAAHHVADSLTQSGGEGAPTQADAMLPAEWKSYLDAYPNVVFSMNAHYHRYQVDAVTLPSGRQYWEVLTSALADFPHGFRVVEIWDQDNGYLMLRATCVDLATDGDSVAAQGRALGTIDLTSGFNPDDGRGKLEDRNVELYIAKP